MKEYIITSTLNDEKVIRRCSEKILKQQVAEIVAYYGTAHIKVYEVTQIPLTMSINMEVTVKA